MPAMPQHPMDCPCVMCLGANAKAPSQRLREDMTVEATRLSNRLAGQGLGKVARVRVEVEFADGSIVAHEARPQI